MSEDRLDLLDDIYTFIRSYIAQHGYSPSVREIACACYASVGTVARYLDKLEAQGRITRVPGQPRTTRLTGDEAEEN